MISNLITGNLHDILMNMFNVYVDIDITVWKSFIPK